MLDPLFDKDITLVAWIDPGRDIFNVNLDWVAYISNRNIWSSCLNKWLGIIDGRTCIDRWGGVVAWNPKDPIRSWRRHIPRPLSPISPLRPLRPLRPLIPLRPLRPLVRHQWSNLTFNEWILGK